MRIAIDATPAARQRAGVGRYTRELVRALVTAEQQHEYLLLVAGSDDDARRLWSTLPPGQWRETRRVPLSDRLVTGAWQRLRFPIAAERFIGEFDLFHGPDFVVPPTAAPTVVTVHDLSFLVAPEYADPHLVRYLSAAVPRALQRANAILTVSATIAGELGERFPNVRERLFAIPNGVSCPPRVERKPARRPTVLMVGTIEPRKDHYCLLSAMELVWDKRPDAQLIVVGRPGWLSDDIVAAIRATRARRPLRWLSNADDATLERCYAAATLVAYPARYEGFGLPVLEAMARGVPVVTSDAPALREVSGGHARSVPAGDAEALAIAILELIDDEEMRSALAAAGQHWSTQFSWDRTAAGTLRAYEFAAGRRRR